MGIHRLCGSIHSKATTNIINFTERSHIIFGLIGGKYPSEPDGKIQIPGNTPCYEYCNNF